MDPVTMMLIGGGTQLLGGMMGASSSAEQAARDVQQQIDQVDEQYLDNRRSLSSSEGTRSLH